MITCGTLKGPMSPGKGEKAPQLGLNICWVGTGPPIQASVSHGHPMIGVWKPVLGNLRWSADRWISQMIHTFWRVSVEGSGVVLLTNLVHPLPYTSALQMRVICFRVNIGFSTLLPWALLEAAGAEAVTPPEAGQNLCPSLVQGGGADLWLAGLTHNLSPLLHPLIWSLECWRSVRGWVDSRNIDGFGSWTFFSGVQCIGTPSALCWIC